MSLAKYKPFVSVIICTYNRGELIEKTINSLLNQSYGTSSFELIVINDGSTDNTAAVLSKLDVRVVSHLKNLGIPTSRNTGLLNSSGEIITFTDDDCIADKNWLYELIQGYKSEKIIAVGGITRPISTSSLTELYLSEVNYGNPAPKEFGRTNNPIFRFWVYVKEMFKSSIVENRTFEVQEIYTLNSSYRRSALIAVGGFDDNLKSNEDVDICTRLKSKYKNGQIVCNSKAIIYHKHRSNLMQFLQQAFNRSENTIVYYLKHDKIPPFFPLPFLVTLLFLIAINLDIIPGLLLCLLAIPACYPWWTVKSFSQHQIRLWILSYVQFLNESITIIGMLFGYLKIHYANNES